MNRAVEAKRCLVKRAGVNQILDGHDAAKVSLFIHHSCQTYACSAQLLHNAICGLIIRGGYDAPYIIIQWFVSVSIEQDLDDID